VQSPVQLTLQTVDGLGKPLENADIHLTILTHLKSLVDNRFSHRGGTKLLEIEAPASKVNCNFSKCCRFGDLPTVSECHPEGGKALYPAPANSNAVCA